MRDIEKIEEVFAKTAIIFKTMADNTRMKMIFALSNTDELRVKDMVDYMQMSQSAISHQLAFLRENNIVKRRKDGKEVYYSLKDNHIKEILFSALEHGREQNI